MGYPRSFLVDPLVSGVYHSPSRCVCRQSLLKSPERCAWLVRCFELLASAFAIDVCDFAVMRNHVHLLLRTHPELAFAWSDEEVVRRWLSIATLGDGNQCSVRGRADARRIPVRNTERFPLPSTSGLTARRQTGGEASTRWARPTWCAVPVQWTTHDEEVVRRWLAIATLGDGNQCSVRGRADARRIPVRSTERFPLPSTSGLTARRQTGGEASTRWARPTWCAVPVQ